MPWRPLHAGSFLAIDDSVRRRIWLTVMVVMVLALVPATFALPVAILEPGSLLVLGIGLLTLAGVAQRALFS
jgi:hypothetical protein